MGNSIFAIPVAILKFLVAIVYISINIVSYPFIVIGKLFDTSYDKTTKIYNKPMTREEVTKITEKLKEEGWIAEEAISGSKTYNVTYRNKRYGGLDRDVKEEKSVPWFLIFIIVLIIVRLVQFISYTVSFPFVFTYCLLQGEEGAPKTDEKFDGYKKSFMYCVYNHACDCRSDVYKTIGFSKKEEEGSKKEEEGSNTKGAKELNNRLSVSSESLSSQSSEKRQNKVPISPKGDQGDTKHPTLEN